jgi:poly(beta-D-mannuronate) lyase
MTHRRLASCVVSGLLALPLLHCAGEEPEDGDCYMSPADNCPATSEVASELVGATAEPMTSTEKQRILSQVGLLGIGRWVRPTLATPSRRVTTVAELKSALVDANAGKIRRIVLAAGTYTAPGTLAITRSGVQITSESLHGAIITGAVNFTAVDADDVLIMGLRFRNLPKAKLFYAKSSERMRVTRVRTDYTSGMIFQVDYGSHDPRFDFNRISFHNGHGVQVKSPASAALSSSKRARILHNEFRDFADLEGDKLIEPDVYTEEGEIMMLGLGYQDGPDQTISSVVEYNLMERVLGDEEALSVKSNGNVIRFNVLGR